MHSAFFLLFKIILAIYGLLWSHTIFSSIFFVCLWKRSLRFWYGLLWVCKLFCVPCIILMMLIHSVNQEHTMSFHLFEWLLQGFFFFPSVIYSFHCKDIVPLWLNLFSGIFCWFCSCFCFLGFFFRWFTIGV